MMEVDEETFETSEEHQVSNKEEPNECSTSFGNISCITTGEENNDSTHETDKSVHKTETNESEKEISMYGSIEDYTYDPTALIEVSDLLDLVGKNWSLFRVSPLWNLDFSQKYLNLLSKELKKCLIKNTQGTKTKNRQKKPIEDISVKIEQQDAHHECVALKIDVIIQETNVQLYTGFLLKSPNYTEKYNKNKLSDMPLLMVQGNQPCIVAIHNWLSDHFDCVIRPYTFALYQFLWIIAISMGDVGKSYNETVLYHYLYKYELTQGQMNVKCHVESSFLRSVLARLALDGLSSEATSFHYSDLIKIQSEIEDHLKTICGINVSKLKLKAFEAPKIASVKLSGKINIKSSVLLDMIIKYLMELENNNYVL
ncbi:Centromere subunit L [Cinara cedri]|uniref:Centromere protein L n=1 Tax=Cinara cedri TaxID=506608 RepID=A0A5E4NS30_9HEMI|nr:Centromere subunit L [Cinara cedri]